MNNNWLINTGNPVDVAMIVAVMVKKAVLAVKARKAVIVKKAKNVSVKKRIPVPMGHAAVREI
jgi:hypothetical protein